jgi:hypothetical protein
MKKLLKALAIGAAVAILSVWMLEGTRADIERAEEIRERIEKEATDARTRARDELDSYSADAFVDEVPGVRGIADDGRRRFEQRIRGLFRGEREQRPD